MQEEAVNNAREMTPQEMLVACLKSLNNIQDDEKPVTVCASTLRRAVVLLLDHRARLADLMATVPATGREFRVAYGDVCAQSMMSVIEMERALKKQCSGYTNPADLLKAMRRSTTTTIRADTGEPVDDR